MQFSRRAVLGLGTVALMGLTQVPTARAQSSWSMSDSSIDTVDGQIHFVRVSSNHLVEWSGFDIPVAAVTWRDVIYIRPGREDVRHVLFDGRPSTSTQPHGNQGLIAVTEFDNHGGSWGDTEEFGEIDRDAGDWSRDLGGSDLWSWQAGQVHSKIYENIIIDPDHVDPTDRFVPSDREELVEDGTQNDEPVNSGIRYFRDTYFYASVFDIPGIEDGVETRDGDGYVTPMPEDVGVRSIRSVANFTVSVNNITPSTTATADGSSEVES